MTSFIFILLTALSNNHVIVTMVGPNQYQASSGEIIETSGCIYPAAADPATIIGSILDFDDANESCMITAIKERKRGGRKE